MKYFPEPKKYFQLRFKLFGKEKETNFFHLKRNFYSMQKHIIANVAWKAKEKFPKEYCSPVEKILTFCPGRKLK